MNLKCSILHADAETTGRLQACIERIPFLTLHGCYTNPLDALRAYYEAKVEVYFVGIGEPKPGDIGGMDFCKMLSTPTRVIFLADTDRYAAHCFRLDALDYLPEDFSFTLFFQSVNKASRWFDLQERSRLAAAPRRPAQKPHEVLNIKSGTSILRIGLNEIRYIEGLGDYVKIHCKDGGKPVISLCSMKYMEGELNDDFLRIHRSFIVRKECIQAIGHSSVITAGKELPVGDTYRDRVRQYVAQLSVL